MPYARLHGQDGDQSHRREAAEADRPAEGRSARRADDENPASRGHRQFNCRPEAAPKADDEGRVVDFHSFRYTFCTLLARRLPIQHVQKLMRHRDIRLTVNIYMDLRLDDLSEMLPNLSGLVSFQSPATKA